MTNMSSSFTHDYDKNLTADKFANCYYFRELNSLVHGFSLKMMIDHVQTLSSTPIKNVLDVGCGEGSMTRILVRDGIVQSAVGIDTSKDMIQLAKNAIQEHEKEHLQYHFFNAEDFETTKIIDKCHLVISTFMLCHMANKDQLYQMLCLIRRLCTGFFVGLIPNPFVDSSNTKKLNKYGITFINPPSFNDEENYFVTFDTNTDNEFTLSAIWYTVKAYESLFRKAGFVTFEWVPLKIDPTVSKNRREYITDACSRDIGFIASV